MRVVSTEAVDSFALYRDEVGCDEYVLHESLCPPTLIEHPAVLGPRGGVRFPAYDTWEVIFFDPTEAGRYRATATRDGAESGLGNYRLVGPELPICVPEPGSLGLLAGLLLLVALSRFRRRLAPRTRSI